MILLMYTTDSYSSRKILGHDLENDLQVIAIFFSSLFLQAWASNAELHTDHACLSSIMECWLNSFVKSFICTCCTCGTTPSSLAHTGVGCGTSASIWARCNSWTQGWNVDEYNQFTCMWVLMHSYRDRLMSHILSSSNCMTDCDRQCMIAGCRWQN